MADLTPIEKACLEKLFNMSGGYVLHFVDRTFAEYFADTFNIDIYTEKYAYGSGSKANRLRAFWRVENNHTVGKCVADFIEFTPNRDGDSDFGQLKQKGVTIADRLRTGAVVTDMEALKPADDEKTFALLYQEVKSSIEKGNPEAALDRLHTYTTRYIRKVAKSRGIDVSNKPLHSLMGEYVGKLKSNGEVGTELAMQILRNGTKLFDAFNDVRNNKSLAHDNELPSSAESLLIVNQIASIIRFLQTLEGDHTS